MMTFVRVCLTLSMGIILSAGCGQTAPETAPVDGVLKMGGQVLDDVRIEFLPDPEKGNVGPLSYAETDANGRFVLNLYGSTSKKGAVIGWHRVTLQDFKSLNSREAPIPPRFGPEFGVASSTPIHFEITSPGATLEIELNEFAR